MKALVEAQKVGKSFGLAKVLEDVTLSFLPGEVHILAGGNGAGKSTLMKILGGVITSYTGSIVLEGNQVRFSSPLDALHQGIAVIHQELSLVSSMSILDNLFLGDVPTKAGFVNRRQMRAEAKEALARVGVGASPESLVGSLPISTQQLVEIAKALRHRARVVIMDEPTSALNVQESARLFELIDGLRASGCAVIYISHKMEDIDRLADRVSVLRDGRLAGTGLRSEMPNSRIISLMAGEDDVRAFESAAAQNLASEPLLEVKDAAVVRGGRRVVDGVSFEIRPGEVFGLGGLEGSGASDLLDGLFGARGPLHSGTVKVKGKPVRVASPRQAMKQGMALVTSDRKATGLILPLTIRENAAIASLPQLAKRGWIRWKKLRSEAAERCRELKVRAASLDLPVGQLSGGNQQKVVLAKWIQTRPRIMLLNEPTRGIDVHAKAEIYRLIDEWKAQGMAVALITSELPELLALSDRIGVMHRGRLTAVFDRSEATAEKVMRASVSA